MNRVEIYLRIAEIYAKLAISEQTTDNSRWDYQRKSLEYIKIVKELVESWELPK